MATNCCSEQTEVQIVVLGPPEVGKTSFIEKYMTDELTATYEPTAHHVFMKMIVFDSNSLKLFVNDLGGSPPPEINKDEIIKKADGIIYVYDITKSDTLNAIKEIKAHALEVLSGKNIPFILVGTKSDMEDEREVLESTASEMATEMNCMFMEASAITGSNVEACFLKLMPMIVEAHKPAPKEVKKKKGCCILL